MTKLGMLGIIGGAALLTAVPVSLQSQNNVGSAPQLPFRRLTLRPRVCSGVRDGAIRGKAAAIPGKVTVSSGAPDSKFSIHADNHCKPWRQSKGGRAAVCACR